MDKQALPKIAKKAFKCIEHHKNTEAKALLDTIFKKEKDLDILLNIAQGLARQQWWFYALKFAERVRKRVKDNAQVTAICGYAAMELGRIDEAEIVIRYAMQLDPDDFWTNYAYLYYLTKSHTISAENAYPIIANLTKDTPHPDVCNVVGTALETIDNIPQAIRYFRQGISLLLTSKSCPPPKPYVKPTLGLLEPALIETHEIFTKLQIPFCLAHGTLLGIYRDGKMLPNDSDVDIMLPWGINRYKLIDMLKEVGCFNCPSHAEIEAKGEWCLSVNLPGGIALEMSFIKVENHRLLTGFQRGNQVIAIPFSKFEFGEIEYLGKKFPIPKNTPLYLQEFYGDEWNKRISNRNFFIINERMIDPGHIHISYTLNHILGSLLECNFKKAYGYALQLNSVHDDPLLQEVCYFLEHHNPDMQWYDPIAPRSNRTHWEMFT